MITCIICDTPIDDPAICPTCAEIDRVESKARQSKWLREIALDSDATPEDRADARAQLRDINA